MARKKKEHISEEFIVGHSQRQFTNSQAWRTEKIEPRWRADNDLYNSRFSKQEREKSDVLLGQGRLFIPKTYSHVQRMLVDILETFFFDNEEIVDISSWKNIPSETREIVKTLLNYRLNSHPINFYQEAYEACLNALKNKVGIFKVYPKLKAEKGVDEEGEEVDNITYFCPIIESLPYEDVFFDRRATWKDYYKFPIVHRMIKSKDYLKRRGYKNLDIVQVAQDLIGNDDIKQQRADYSAYSSSPFNNDVQVKNSDSVFVYEFWDFLDVNGDGLLESCSYIMAGDAQGPKVVIRGVEENFLPYKDEGEDYNRSPIIIGNAFPESHELYGKSLPEITEGLQKETNAIRNQRREAVALTLRKPILANRSANIDLMALVNRRIGGVVMGDDISPNSIREMDISDPTNSTIQEQMRTDQDFYETTSISPNLLGMPASADETATAVTSHTANANKKIQQVIKNLANTLFLPAFKMLLRLEQEYESDEFIMLVTGRKLGWNFGQDGTPAKVYILGDFDLTCNIGINKQLQLNKWMMLMDRANMTNQGQAQLVSLGVASPETVQFVDVAKMYDKMLPILGEKNIAEYKIQSQQPPMEMGAGPGIASQTSLPSDMEAGVMNMNPEGYSGVQ